MPAPSRTIRVFISSTFRDMHAERDYLNRVVFPELRSRCQKRGVEFIGLDLRWGVTEQEAQREGALKICLDEIERCRPFFVCLLGSRYGWAPPPAEVPRERFEEAVRGTRPGAITEWYALDETNVPPVYRLRNDRSIPENVAESLARFWEDAHLPKAGESITAREILRGVFEENFPATHALFYLRKPGIEVEPGFPVAFVPVFVEQDTRLRARLKSLEGRIRECGNRMVVRDYEVGFTGLRIDPILLPAALSDEERELLKDGVVNADKLDRCSTSVREAIQRRGMVGLSGLETLGNQILEDLWAAIEKELGRPVKILDDHQRERAYHDRFVVDRTRLFQGRNEIVERILAGLADPAGGNLTVVTGVPGSGKSALLAECALRARERFHGALVIPHFIGASPGSAILANTLQSVCGALKRECGITDEIPADPQKLSQKWPEFLEKAGAKKRIILIVDAVNQLDPLDHSHELGWIPFRIPKGVTLIVSTLPGDCLDRIRSRVSAKAVIDVPVLEEADRRALVREFLSRRRKRLLEDQEDPRRDQLRRLLDSEKRPEVGLPLYLLVALEELSLFGSYEALGDRIGFLPPTVAELFDQVLARLEQDHGRDMTASICQWIAVSRSGMLESEILDLLAGREQLFPRARWARFYRALEPYLRPVEEQTGEGLLAFYHDQLRFAVYRRYLDMKSPEASATPAYRAAHTELARYFRALAIEADVKFPKWRWDRKRSLGELPHHQLNAGLWEALEKTLTDIYFVEAKSRAGMVQDLVHDFTEAERSWPGQEDESRKEEMWQERVREYGRQMIAYSRAHKPRNSMSFLGRWLNRLVRLRYRPKPLPPPPSSVVRTANNPLTNQDSRMSLDRIRAWANFVSNHAVQLASGEQPAFQVAYNSVASGPVAETLQECLARGEGPSAPWIALVNRPPFLAHPACLKTLADSDPVVALVATPDARCAVTGSANALRVWNLETGENRILNGHVRPVTAIDMTPDARRAISGSDDGTLRVWNLETGDSRVLTGHTAKVNCVSMTPDGRYAVSGSDDRTARLWDLDTLKCRIIKKQKNEMRAVTLTPDGRRAVSGGGRATEEPMFVIDLETGRSRDIGEPSWSNTISLSPDGRHAVSADWNRCLRISDLESGECREFREPCGASVLRTTPDGRHAVSAGGGLSDHAMLRVWDLETGESRILTGHAGPIRAISVTPDGRRAVTGSEDRTLRVWDLEWGESSVVAGHADAVTSVAATPDGRYFISGGGSHDRTLRVWSTEPGNCRVLKGHGHSIEFVKVTPDGRRAISGSGDCTVRMWDLESGSSRIIFKAEPQRHALAACVSPDGRQLIVATMKRKLLLIDLATGATTVLHVDKEHLSEIALTPDGLCAVFLDINNPVRMLDFASGEFRSFKAGGGSALAVTPDGRNAVFWLRSRDRCCWWNLASDSQTFLTKDMRSPNGILVTPDGRYALTKENGFHPLRLWDVCRGSDIASYYPHGVNFASMAMHYPRMLAVGLSTGQVQFLRPVGSRYGESLRLPGPCIVTLVRLWLHDPGLTGGHWDEAITATCGACGQRFPTPTAILDTIAAITRNSCLGSDASPCLKLPAEAWDEPGLLSECPLCHEPLKFNPFVVDNRDRYP